MQYLGILHVWGAASPSVGFNCSGLTSYVFAQVRVSLPHYAAAQYGYGVAVSKDQLQAGDLVFFRSLGHMGMYIGGGSFIHAPRTGDVVKISSLSTATTRPTGWEPDESCNSATAAGEPAIIERPAVFSLPGSCSRIAR